MKFNSINIANGNIVVNAICAIAFSVFTFIYLYFYQSDVLMSTQHALSEGVTHYDPAIGGVIITLVLLLLQICISAFFRKTVVINAMTYFPSLFLLGVLTSYDLDNTSNPYSSCWLWLIPLLLALWACVMFGLKKLYSILPKDNLSEGFFRTLWINLLLMVSFFTLTGAIGASDEILHYRMRMERLMQDKEFEKALAVGSSSKATDEHLSMLRIYASSRMESIGDSLFHLDLSATKENLFPFDSLSLFFYPGDSIFRHLGAIPRGDYNADIYAKVLKKSNLATDGLRDYELIGDLLNCDLDAFVSLLPSYYEINDSLPNHYKEALAIAECMGLYCKSDTAYSVRLCDYLSVKDADYKDNFYRRLKEREFQGTYWEYYFSRKKLNLISN